MLVWVSVKTFCQCLIQYVWFLLQHNPLAILVQRQRRLGFVENYGEVLIKPKVKERVLDMFLTGTYTVRHTQWRIQRGSGVRLNCMGHHAIMEVQICLYSGNKYS